MSQREEKLSQEDLKRQRNEEYLELMAAMERPAEGVEQTLERAIRRKRRRNLILRPAVGLAACFALFVLLVNYSLTVAYACSQIPGLKELAEAVTFSRSLSDAVENQYVQTIDLRAQDGDVTAQIEYLIVDQKQVNVFYRLDSEVYTQMNARPRVLDADGSAPPPCSYAVNDWDVPNGELQSITIDFVEEDVPGCLLLKLDIQDFGVDQEAPPRKLHEDDIFHPGDADEDITYVAYFEFLLEFDPEYTEQGQVYDVNETVILDGQKITITDVEVYPTHLRVNLKDDPENTAWICGLDFRVIMNGTLTFDPVSSGIIATGDGSGNMTSYRADSPFFYEARELDLVIVGAEWLRKDMEKVKINLETGESETLPEGVEFHSAEKKSGGWILRMRTAYREENHFHQILQMTYYDALGQSYSINSFGSYGDYEDETQMHYIEEVALADYHESEVWVSPSYSHLWVAESPVSVKIR